jgi:hypothetical protein
MADFKKWPKGTSGNLAGRPVGSRNRASLNARFIEDLAKDWEEHGAESIRIMRMERPGEYVKCVASILPRAVSITTEQAIQELSDEQLVDTLRAIRDQLSSSQAN